MTPSRPYLIRAIYEWIVDNDLTPYLLVDAEAEGVIVPTQYIENGKIILNISQSATQGLRLENDGIYFSARFSGSAMNIDVPIEAAMAVYAKENGRGMVFSDEDGLAPPPDDTPPPEKPKLRVVK